MTGVQERALEPIQPTPLIEELVARLRELIDSDRYGPGDRLPSERSLSKDLLVGRSTIREALRALEALGLIKLRQGREAYVPAEAAVGGAGPGGRRVASELSLADRRRDPFARDDRAGDCRARRPQEEERGPREPARCARRVQRGWCERRSVGTGAGRRCVPRCGRGCANRVLAGLLTSMRSYGILSRSTSLRRRERWESVRKRRKGIYQAIAADDPEAAVEHMESQL
jgi:hypothetical protein